MKIEREEIVVGSSLAAVLYAFINELPLFYSVPYRPFRFDYFSPDVDLSSVKLDPVRRELKSFGTDKVVGIAKNDLWERLLFLMSLTGQVPLSNICSSIRFSGDHFIFSDEYAKLLEVEFNKCHYFGDRGCLDFLTEETVDEPSYICYDWIAFNRGGKHEIDYISTDDKFVEEVWFYSSDRIDGETQVKDACVVSRLEHSQIEDFDYSETTTRFKLIHEMEARGMKGLFNGYGKNGNPKYYKFRTSYISRRLEPAHRTYRSSSPKIRIATESEEALIESLSKNKANHQRTIGYL